MKITNIKLLLTGTALAALGALSLQACSSSDDSSSSGGSGGTATGGSSSGGKGGTSSTAGTSSGGKGGTSSTGGTGTGGTGTGGTGTGNAGTGAGAEGGVPGGDMGGDTGTAGAAGETLAQLCTTFCADEQTICTFGAATVAPYTDSNACLAACNAFTEGDVGVYPDGPQSGDTFACRRWHLSKAGDTGPVATHCPHTGTLSKVAYADATATGPCKN